MSFAPLLWKNYEKTEKDEHWPKRLTGASIIFEENNKYFVIGGQFNAYDNLVKNYELNNNIIKGVDKKIDEFSKYNNDKVNYIVESVIQNQNKQLEVYSLNLEADKKWNKVNAKGRIPPSLSGHRCMHISNNILIRTFHIPLWWCSFGSKGRK
jgi:hypothetical protein